MARTDGAGASGSATAGRPHPKDVSAPSAKRQKKTNSNDTEESYWRKTELDVMAENWPNVHSFLNMDDVVSSSKTCHRLHDLCVDDKGKLRVYAILWSLRGQNKKLGYRMLQRVCLDGIRALSIVGGLVEGGPLTFQEVVEITTIFNKLASEETPFSSLVKFAIFGDHPFPDGLELISADIGAKLAHQSPALRTLMICGKAFSRTAFELIKPVLQKDVLTTLYLGDHRPDEQKELIGSDQAAELAQLIVDSSNLEYLHIDLEDSEGESKVSPWFKRNLLPAIIRHDSTGATSSKQRKLRTLHLSTKFADNSCCLDPDQLGTTLNHFARGGNLVDMTLSGPWTGTESMSQSRSDYAFAIGDVLDRHRPMQNLEFSFMHDEEGSLLTTLFRSVLRKKAPCEMKFYPIWGEGLFTDEEEAEWKVFIRCLVESMIPLIEGHGSGSRWKVNLVFIEGGFGLKMSEAIKEG